MISSELRPIRASVAAVSVAVTWRRRRVASVLRQTAQKEMPRQRQTRAREGQRGDGRGDFGFDFGSRALLFE